MSARLDLAATLRANLPLKAKKPVDSFVVLDVEDLPDTIDRATVIVCQRDYTRAPNAQGSMFVGFVVTVLSPITDRDKAEDHLEWALPQVLEAVDKEAGLSWTRATRTVIKGFLGYDIDTSIPIPLPY